MMEQIVKNIENWIGEETNEEKTKHDQMLSLLFLKVDLCDRFKRNSESAIHE